ncbi:NAD(P)-dependent alcohol dehydrogenase [Arthrobacter sp. CAN_C5]|uniref:NAD(P)-dependent alcohol dehydrogenase n=1 Tax=Arthrobacter sp. CAN_C5 TaxID=2760706 RepID=UPI001FD9C953|nr:NAD(P)-dependent alcohol dehydrogenase [Arthrobacter sp. CAN_C5]MBP2216909.1 NADPH:quinone reductase-like Zn-dependent oxidoreductase [Arthrobacter sp. CAN_C5]
MNTPPADVHTAAPQSNTMMAIVHDGYGVPSEVLRLERIPRPSIGEKEVLVRVRAASVDPGIAHMVTGLPYPVRLASRSLRAPKGRVPGFGLAGQVVSVGASVTGIVEGDNVFGIGAGSFAEYSVCRDDKIALMPDNLDFNQAAAIPVSGLAALQGLRDHGKVQPGYKVLVVGASGGVGTFAVQIAKALGADVTGVCSASKVEMVRSIGADHVIDYKNENFADGATRYDVILDTGGNSNLGELRRALSSHGTLVIVGGEAKGRWFGGTDRILCALVLNPFVTQTLRAFISTEDARNLRALAKFAAAGHLVPVMDQSYSLANAISGMRRLEEGQAKGKIVVTIP